MLGPITPHLAEEGWSLFTSNKGLLCDQPWPKFDESLVVENIIKMPIQINGKKKAEIEINKDIEEKKLKEMTLNNPNVKSLISDKKIKKLIVIPGRIINIVI